MQEDTLLAATERVLARHGLVGATMERIATEAGVARVTLYRHGVRKETLVEALVARALEAYRAALWPVLTGAGSGRERLERALLVVCEQAEVHRALLTALAGDGSLFHEHADGHVHTRSEWTQPLERLLMDGAADGSLRAVPAEETATLLFNLVGWSYLHVRSGHHWPPERAAGDIVALVLCGVAA